MGKRGGARPGAGRPPKADEQKLIERLTPMDDTALEKLFEAVAQGEQWAITLFMAYRYGKPREKKDVNLTAEQPIFEL